MLVLGLGCENCNIPVLMDYIGEYDPERVKFLQCQDCEDEMEAAMELLGQLYEKASGDVRVECDASQLIIGMKCGGSDGPVSYTHLVRRQPIQQPIQRQHR